MDELAVDIPKAFTPWQVNRLRARLLIYYMCEHWSYAEYKRRAKLKPRGLVDASSRPRRPSYMTLAMDIETCPACEGFVFAGDSMGSSPFVESARQDDGALISARSLQLFLGGDIKVDRDGRQYRKFSTPDNTQNGRTKLAAIQAFLRHHKLIADDQFEDEGLRDFCLDLSRRFEGSGIALVNPLDYPLFDGDYVGEKEFEYGRVVERLALHATPAGNRLHIYDPIYGVRCEELRFVRHHGESTAALELRVSRGQWDECIWHDGGGALAIGLPFQIYLKSSSTHEMEIRSLTEAYALSEKVSAFHIYDDAVPGEFRFKIVSKDEFLNSLKVDSYKSISEIICNYANNNDTMTSKSGSKEGARPKPKLRGKFLFKRDEIQLDAKKEVDAELEQKKKQLERALAERWGPIVTRDEPPIEPNLDLMPMSERDLSILNCRVMSSAASARRKYPSVEGASIEEKLLFAAQNALPDLAGNLIEAGADVNYVSPETGKTPLLAAATSSTRFVILRLLEEPSVDHLVRDKSGQIAVGIFAEKAPADDPLVEQLVNAAMEQAKERGIEFSSLFSLPGDTPYPS